MENNLECEHGAEDDLECDCNREMFKDIAHSEVILASLAH